MKCLIYGCGYLGSEVASYWKAANNDVHVVTRSQKNADQFRNLGYQAVVADITEPSSLKNVSSEFDVILFSVGFDRSRYGDIREVYVDGLGNVLNHIGDAARHFIYISSTGVYGNNDGSWVDEETVPNPIRPGGQACLEAESLVRSSQLSDRYSILRLAGIYGPGRIPKVAAIRNRDWSQLGQTGHVNLIHNFDAARIVDTVTQQSKWQQTYLVSDGNPTPRKQFYDFIAERLGTSPIDWSINVDPAALKRANSDKKISNRKLLDQTGYEFRYPDYRSGILQAIENSD